MLWFRSSGFSYFVCYHQSASHTSCQSASDSAFDSDLFLCLYPLLYLCELSRVSIVV